MPIKRRQFNLRDETNTTWINILSDQNIAITDTNNHFTGQFLDDVLDELHSNTRYYSFTNILVGETTISADIANDTLTFSAGTGITLTPNAQTDTVQISVSSNIYAPLSHTHGGSDVTSAVASSNDSDKLDGFHSSSFARLDADSNPDADNTRILGTADKKYNNIFSTTFTGNATTSSKLAASVTINGVSFDGSANILTPGSLLTLGTPLYDDDQDYVNIVQSSGRISGGVITEHSPANGTVDISEMQGFIKISDSDIGTTKFFVLPQQLSVSLTDNNINYIYCDYNSGTPRVLVTTNRRSIRRTDQFTIGRAFRQGNILHILQSGINTFNKTRLIHERWVDTFGGFSRASGAVVSNPTGVKLATTDGVFYAGSNRIDTTGINTNSGSTFRYHYYNPTTLAWVETLNNTDIDTTHYNNVASGTGLVSLSSNKYGVFWVYLCTDGVMHVLYGRGDYTLSQAQAAAVPISNPSLPNYLTKWTILAGKIIVSQANPTQIYSITSTWSDLLTISSKPTLEEIQDNLGGTTGGDGFIRSADGHLTISYADNSDVLTLTSVPNLSYYPTGIEFGLVNQSYDITGSTWVTAVAGGTLGGITNESNANHKLTNCISAISTARDNTYLNVREASGVASPTNPLTVHFLFSNIISFTSIDVRSYYIGSNNHNMAIQLWNYSTNAWDTFATFAGEADYVSRGIIVFSYLSYVNNGNVKLQFIHTSSGLTSHELRFEYVALNSGGGGSGGSVQSSAVSYTPTGNIAATNVQTAINELDNEKVPYSGASGAVTLGQYSLTTGAGIITPKIYPSSDSTTAIQLNKADSSSVVLNVDTTNGYVGINKNNPSTALDVTGTITATSFADVYTNTSSVILTTSNVNINQVVDSISALIYRTVEYLIQITSGSSYQSSRILIVHDGSTTYMTEHAVIKSGDILATFTSDIDGTNLRLLTTPTNSITVIKAKRIAIYI